MISNSKEQWFTVTEQFNNIFTNQTECQECDRDKMIECTRCSGAGRLPRTCSRCLGSGIISCPDC